MVRCHHTNQSAHEGTLPQSPSSRCSSDHRNGARADVTFDLDTHFQAAFRLVLSYYEHVGVQQARTLIPNEISIVSGTRSLGGADAGARL